MRKTKTTTKTTTTATSKGSKRAATRTKATMPTPRTQETTPATMTATATRGRPPKYDFSSLKVNQPLHIEGIKPISVARAIDRARQAGMRIEAKAENGGVTIIRKRPTPQSRKEAANG